MPAKQKSRGIPRCAYKEGSQRCVKNATTSFGEMSFCAAHARVMTNAVRGVADPPGAGQSVIHKAAGLAGDVLRDFLDGKPLNREKVASAINEFAWDLGGSYAQYMPPVQDVPIDTGAPGAGARRRPGAPPPPSSADEEAYKASELRKAAVHARAVLGFGPREAITEATLKRRHRELTKRYHPDRQGGDLAKMQQVNAAVDLIAETIRD